MAYYRMPPEFLYNYQKAIQAVTKEQIQKAFKDITEPDKLVTIVIK
jgi:predicted Zn-dependent peptidase